LLSQQDYYYIPRRGKNPLAENCIQNTQTPNIGWKIRQKTITSKR